MRIANRDYYNIHRYVCTKYTICIFDRLLLEKVMNSKGIILMMRFMGTRHKQLKNKYSQVGKTFGSILTTRWLCLSKHSIYGSAGGSLVSNPPARAEERGSTPGPGRSHLPPKPVHHSYWSPSAPEPMLYNERCHHDEWAQHRDGRGVPARLNERKSLAATKTQHSHK